MQLTRGVRAEGQLDAEFLARKHLEAAVARETEVLGIGHDDERTGGQCTGDALEGEQEIVVPGGGVDGDIARLEGEEGADRQGEADRSRG